jgi:dienelactone hydrolase
MGNTRVSQAILLSATVAAAAALPSRARAESGFVALRTGPDTSIRAYAAGPGDAKAGVLILHDYFGVSEFTKASADRLAGLGYRVIAVDLYGGRSATAHEQARQLMQALMNSSVLGAALPRSASAWEASRRCTPT